MGTKQRKASSNGRTKAARESTGISSHPPQEEVGEQRRLPPRGSAHREAQDGESRGDPKKKSASSYDEAARDPYSDPANPEEEDETVDEPVDFKSAQLEEGLGYGSDDGPESQGASAGQGFGRDRQGSFSDEDYDPSYDSGKLESGETGDLDVDEIPDRDRDVATGDLAALEQVRTRQSSEDETTSVRSDDQIREDIEERLVVLGEDVAVEVTNGEVLLMGTVRSDRRRDKIDQRAQDVPGVRAIENRIVVDDEGT